MKLKYFFLILILVFSFSCNVFASGSILKQVVEKESFGTKAAGIAKSGTPEEYLYTQIGDIILIALRIVGIVLLVVIIYAGFTWLTAGGNQEKVTTARKWITNGIIGIVIIGLAYLIVGYVVGNLFG